LYAASAPAEADAWMADQQSVDAQHLIARIKRIPQIIPNEVEARHSQPDRETGCGQRPSEGMAVVGRGGPCIHNSGISGRVNGAPVGRCVRSKTSDCATEYLAQQRTDE